MTNCAGSKLNSVKKVMTAVRIGATGVFILTNLVHALQIRAQSQATVVKPPPFEVASVKPNKSESGLIGGGCHGVDSKYSGAFPIAPPPLGRCVMTRVTLKMLVQTAYSLIGPNADQLVQGGPSWFDSDRFDIEAKAEGPPATEAQLKLMLQTLLADRFKLTLHRETRGDTPAYALVVAKDGPKLKEATGNEEHAGVQGGLASSLTATRASISLLADMLSRRLGRPVEDKTNLPGTYNFTLKWTPGDNEINPLTGFNLPPEILAQLKKSEPDGPSIFTALQEQLGLRLETEKIGREILVIDGAQKPSLN
jgi:bla regulator protein blaR1